MLDIKNKVIWITGASSGIGEALAKACADKGAKLVLSARNTDKLNQLKNELPHSANHRVVPLDLANPEGIADIVSPAISTIGAIDILVNNGGISQRGFAINTELSVQKQVMEVNYFGTIAMTQAVLGHMKKAGRGMIVNVASVAGLVGGKSMSGYSASKHAVIGYMNSLRAEETVNGIHVLNVCPGFVQTQISVNAFNGDGSKFNAMAGSIKNGISVDSCAKQMITAIEQEKAQVIIGKGISYWAPTIYRFFPTLFRKLSSSKNYRE